MIFSYLILTKLETFVTPFLPQSYVRVAFLIYFIFEELIGVYYERETDRQTETEIKHAMILI